MMTRVPTVDRVQGRARAAAIASNAKRLVQRGVGLFGYELRPKTTDDAFAVQRQLIRISEPIIFDVGANVGSTTKTYRALFPSASIYSFEPFRPIFERLEQATGNDDRTSIYNLAVSDVADTVTLYSNVDPKTNSILPTDSRSTSYWRAGLYETKQRVEVSATTVDSFCDEHAIPRVDILKLDIQGAEFAALSGAREMLSRELISLIYSEVILAPTYEHQHRLHQYFSLLDSFGYELLDFYNPVRKRMQLLQADFLFLSPRLKEHLTERR